MTKYMNPHTIWQYKQNKPSLIAQDFLESYDIPLVYTHYILLKRGVYKWLSVREDLIKLKIKWAKELTDLYIEVSEMKKGTPKHREKVGRIKALEQCRKEVRELCHSPRWRAPQRDRKAGWFLEYMEERDEAISND